MKTLIYVNLVIEYRYLFRYWIIYPCTPPKAYYCTHQVLRKRFVYGEIVECYVQQVGFAQGWFSGYVMSYLPNAFADAFASSSRSLHETQDRLQFSTSMYEVFLRGLKGGVRAQKVRVPSYCIRKVLGYPMERIFPERMRSPRSRIGADAMPNNLDKEMAERLRKFRATLSEYENKDIEVAVVEGVPLKQQSFRHATCTRVPGTLLGRLFRYENTKIQACTTDNRL